MRKLSVFDFTSLDGYYKGVNEDLSWNRLGPEETEFSAGNVRSGNTLLFGRVTYEMMESFWTTPDAMKILPEIARGMNSADKIVFSKSLKKADWNNTIVVNGDLVDEVRKLKQLPGKDMTILGSGNIVSQLADAGLIDEYQIMIYAVAIGEGTPIFKGIKNNLSLKLVSSRVFNSGTVLLCYQPE